MIVFLTIKEIWRGKGRFFLFSMVIALITVLVLFIAGLAEGLAAANKEYIEKVDGQLIAFQENVKLSTLSSRLSDADLRQIRRVDGVSAVGPVALSNATIVLPDGEEPLDVSLVGVRPGQPGEAPAFEGRNLDKPRAFETVIDGNLADRNGIALGDEITIKTIQATDEELFTLEVVGITDGRQFFFLPSIFVPEQVWDKVRSQPAAGEFGREITYNIMAIQLDDPNNWEPMAAKIQDEVDGVEVVDPVTAYEAAPGYAEQQGTLNTQRAFTMLIGILVIGGFFQIQTIQKIPNIGMLKALGLSNGMVGGAVVLQIILVTAMGVLIGAALTFGLSLGLPSGIPILFTPQSAATAIVSLILIGPAGGLVSVRQALKVEPLIALGLSS
ncbi:MAG: ABC transporter permease [Anaerolineales bacterium]|nr:ABC transporter permease [Anaerolineales bacterium]